MAQGWTNQLKKDEFIAYSAGIETHGLNPMAVKVMAEAGVDISHHESTHVTVYKNMTFDYIITVCDNARESCPVFPGPGKRIHARFDDPPSLAAGLDNEEDRLNCYRKVRDEIKAYIMTL